MSFNPICHQMVKLCASYLPEEKSVVELGNQTINLPDDPRNGESAELVYKELGFGKYTCIDSNDRHGAVVCDINSTIHPGVDSCELVTNNGTGEHIFDQSQVFRTCHSLCKNGGLMLHILPFLNWPNHCFYSYHPLLFVDLAAANGYKLVYLSIANRWGFQQCMHGWKPEQMVEQVKPKTKKSPLHDAILDVWCDEKQRTGATFPNIMVVAILKRMRKSGFRYPQQGKYIDDISSDEIMKEYECQQS